MLDAYLIMSMIFSIGIAILIGAIFFKMGMPLPAGERIGFVDGLRGYLAISVMFHHFIVWLGYKVGLPWAEPVPNLYNELGQAAVAMFFMATGLCFYPRIVDGFRATNWRLMYNGRLFRIVPMLLVSTLSSALVVAVENKLLPTWHFSLEVLEWLSGQQEPLMNVESSPTVNARVLWSIQWEWIFYLTILPLFSALRLACRRDRLWILLVSLLVLSLLGREIDFAIFRYLPLFIFGMLASEAITHASVKAFLSQRWMAVPLIVILLAATNLFHSVYGLVPMALLAIVFASVAAGNDLLGLLSSRGARILGEISFSIYVMHGIVLHLAFRNFPVERAPAQYLPALLVVAVLIAALCFVAVERPAMKLGKRFYAWALPR